MVRSLFQQTPHESSSISAASPEMVIIEYAFDTSSSAVSCGSTWNDSSALPPMHLTCAFVTAITSSRNLWL